MSQYGTHALDTPENERQNVRDFLVNQGIQDPSDAQVDAALRHILAGGKEPYLTALRAPGKVRR
jgi:hypothetical protein